MAQQQQEEQEPQFVFEFKGTILCDIFHPEKDARDLRGSMKGIGTDEKEIIAIVGNRTNKQRQTIEKVYKETYGRDLKEDLKKELSGDFEDVVVAMFYSPVDYDVHCLHKAMHGPGTDEEALIEILATRSNEQINQIKVAYKAKYGKELEEAIACDTSGPFKRMLTILLTATRDESSCVDHDLARADAKALFDAGVKCWGTDESKFNEIFCKRNFPQLRATFFFYKRQTGHTITDAIDKELSGDMKKGLRAIVLISYYAPTYFVKRLHDAMAGVGTDDSTLIRIIVSRSEVDLWEIKVEYKNCYEKTLYDRIKHDTSGDYRRMLLAIVE